MRFRFNISFTTHELEEPNEWLQERVDGLESQLEQAHKRQEVTNLELERRNQEINRFHVDHASV